MRDAEQMQELSRALQPIAFFDAEPFGMGEPSFALGGAGRHGENRHQVRNLPGINRLPAKRGAVFRRFDPHGSDTALGGRFNLRAEARQNVDDGTVALERREAESLHGDALGILRERPGAEPEGGIGPVAFDLNIFGRREGASAGNGPERQSLVGA